MNSGWNVKSKMTLKIILEWSLRCSQAAASGTWLINFEIRSASWEQLCMYFLEFWPPGLQLVLQTYLLLKTCNKSIPLTLNYLMMLQSAASNHYWLLFFFCCFHLRVYNYTQNFLEISCMLAVILDYSSHHLNKHHWRWSNWKLTDSFYKHQDHLLMPRGCSFQAELIRNHLHKEPVFHLSWSRRFFVFLFFFFAQSCQVRLAWRSSVVWTCLVMQYDGWFRSQCQVRHHSHSGDVCFFKGMLAFGCESFIVLSAVVSCHIIVLFMLSYFRMESLACISFPMTMSHPYFADLYFCCC